MWRCVFVAGIVYDFQVEECSDEGALWKNPSRCCWTPISLLAAKRVLVKVNYDAAEGIRNTLVPVYWQMLKFRGATLLVLVGVDEGSLMEVSMIPESTNDAALPTEQA